MTEQTNHEPFISMNALLFFLLPTMGMIIVIGNAITQFYVAGGWLLPFALFALIAPLVYISLGSRPSAQTDRRRFIWVMIASAVLVVGLTIRQFIIRPPADTPRGMYDGAVQSEVAADFIIHGKNPYGADYRGTPYANLNKPVIGNNTDNEVWYHYIYPPLNFLLFVPISLLKPVLGPLTDYRLITVGGLFFLTWLLTRRVKTWSQKITVVLLTLSNPLLWAYAIIGCNDLLVTTAIVGTTLLIERRRWWLAGAVFGLALAAKQVAWVVSPLWIYWLWHITRHTPHPWKNFKQTVIGAVTIAGVIFAPFLIWSAPKMFTDLVTYAGGAIPQTYPIAGTTFLQYLRIFHIVYSPYTVVPVYLFQLLVGVPVFFLTASWVRSNSQPSRWLAGAAVLLLAIMMVSRFFNNNFLTIPAILFGAAYVFQHHEAEPQSSDARHD